VPIGPSRWPARLDVLQGLTGLLLVAFVWAHMFFESSILLGKDAMYWVTGLFEGRHFLDRPLPVLVSIVAAVIIVLVAVHALLAIRRLPASHRRYRALRRHTRALDHDDTTLWYLQVVTGLALFLLLPPHLYMVLVQPENIGPYASSDRVWSGRFWLLYAPLLLAVHLHAAAGTYRLVMKWLPPSGATAAVSRARLRRAMWGIVGFFVLLGSLSLAAYMTIGADHADRVGERYRPADVAAEGH